MKLRPLNDYVIIKPNLAEEITKSGIVLPGTIDKENPDEGIVEAVGNGKLLDNGQRAPMNVKVGDRVRFRKYTVRDLKIDSEEYLVVAESDIIAVIEE